MGFDINRATCPDDIDKELLCSICVNVLQDAVYVGGGCEHAFCRDCIQQWLNQKPECPLGI